MITFAIVSSNAWAAMTTQNQWHDSASRKSLAKHARQIFLTNPDAAGKIRNNWEGQLVIGKLLGIIGNYQELSGIIGTRFLPIFPDNSQSGKIGSGCECRISVSGIAIVLQIFSQMPYSHFFVECPSHTIGSYMKYWVFLQ
jgi:hypothetical protein